MQVDVKKEDLVQVIVEQSTQIANLQITITALQRMIEDLKSEEKEGKE